MTQVPDKVRRAADSARARGRAGRPGVSGQYTPSARWRDSISDSRCNTPSPPRTATRAIRCSARPSRPAVLWKNEAGPPVSPGASSGRAKRRTWRANGRIGLVGASVSAITAAPLGRRPRQFERGRRVGRLRHHDQRVALAQGIGLVGGAAQAADQHAVAAQHLVGIAHLEGDAEGRAGAQEAGLAGGQQRGGGFVEGGVGVDGADGFQRGGLPAGEGGARVHSGRFGARACRRAARSRQPASMPWVSARWKGARKPIGVAAGGARHAQHGGGRHAHGLGLAPHGPQADLGRIVQRPARRPLEFGGQAGQHVAQAVLERGGHGRGTRNKTNDTSVFIEKQLFYMGWARTSARAGHGGFSE